MGSTRVLRVMHDTVLGIGWRLGVKMESKKIDLRSDTVTKPTADMRAAMANAEVGDDVYGEDPSVNLLESTAANMMGKEAGLFVPSGTMGNLIAILTWCRERGSEVILGAESHTFYYEVANASALGGVGYHTLREDSTGKLTPQQIEHAIRGHNIHFPKTSLLCLENTHNRCGGTLPASFGFIVVLYRSDFQNSIDKGTILNIAQTKELCDVAHKHNIPVHLDGARVFNAAAALKVDVKDLVAELDSVQFCLSKGLGAPIGSMLVGPADFIARARGLRKMLGGGMRQVGVIAAAGLLALKEMPKRLSVDHDNCRFLAEHIAQTPGLSVQLETVQTNIVYFDCSGTTLSAKDFVAKLTAAGVLSNATGPTQIRFVTHYDVDKADCEEAIKIVKQITAAHVK